MQLKGAPHTFHFPLPGDGKKHSHTHTSNLYLFLWFYDFSLRVVQTQFILIAQTFLFLLLARGSKLCMRAIIRFNHMKFRFFIMFCVLFLKKQKNFFFFQNKIFHRKLPFKEIYFFSLLFSLNKHFFYLDDDGKLFLIF